MKTKLSNFIAAVMAAVFSIFLLTPAGAATWNTSLGMGNPADDWLFSGTGQLNGHVANNRSNTIYYITSAKSSGAPKVTSLQCWTDATRPFIEAWVATNTWTCASNQPAGTNTLWLSSTNSGLTTNDVLVLRDVANDCYQLVTLDAVLLKLTNSAGHNGISLLTVTSNTITAGDMLYKMARTQVINPGFWYQSDYGTNLLNGTKTNYYTLAPGQFISGPQGLPTMVSIFATNHAACWLTVAGEYYVRPRR